MFSKLMGVSPVYCGQNAREQAFSYTRQRAGYGRTEIQVLDDAWNVIETIGNEQARPLVRFIFLRSFSTVVGFFGAKLRNSAKRCADQFPSRSL